MKYFLQLNCSELWLYFFLCIFFIFLKLISVSFFHFLVFFVVCILGCYSPPLRCFFFFLSMPTAFGSSQARDQTCTTTAVTWAAAVTTSHLNLLNHKRTPTIVFYIFFIQLNSLPCREPWSPLSYSRLLVMLSVQWDGTSMSHHARDSFISLQCWIFYFPNSSSSSYLGLVPLKRGRSYSPVAFWGKQYGR